MNIVNKAAIGMVTIHDRTIFFIIPKLSAFIPLANPTPITEPTMVCEVEIGNPNFEHIRTVVAALNSAENPLVGVISVILSPIVSITL